ncbi:MAG: ThuA domain-containing protein [Thermoguttaceae bacterium]|jgi:type 1 glutamine amidotransferase|nr:ThuA domain-containing protein [Thermoguttaceae bacterium]
MKRREMLISTGAALLGLSAFPLRWAAAAEKKFKILYFTRSAGFEHSVVHRPGGQLSHSEKIMVEAGQKYGVEVVCSKDGRVFDGDLDQFDAFAFYTSGDLTQPLPADAKRDEPPMSKKGLERLLAAIKGGKGFVGFHAATDSFHSQGDQLTPYVKMIGGEFVTHGRQQKATMKVASPEFPGMDGIKDFELLEEWYALKNFAPDLHVILVQETAGMTDECYQRPPFPATWARMHGKGRVFYTSLGHREDIWTNPIFQQIVVGGFSWVLGETQFDPKPNIAQVTPKAGQMKN